MIARHLAEPEAKKEPGDGGTCILVGGGEDAGGDRGLAKVLDGLGSNFAFKTGIDRDEKPRPPFEDVGPRVVERHGENLGGRQVDTNGAIRKLNSRGGELVEVNACNRLAVDFEKDAVTGEDGRQVAAFAVSGNDFVHGIGNRFEARQAADLHHDRRLRGIDTGGAV